MMSDIVFRSGKLTALRPVERGDVAVLRMWLNDPEITQYLDRAFPLTEKEEEEWVDNLHRRDTDFVFMIVEKKSGKEIGSIGLHRINWTNRTATTGTVIGDKKYHGKGYGTDAKMLLHDFAFNRLDLYGVMSTIHGTNGRSIAYGRKCGYTEVGRIPAWNRKLDGTRCDGVILLVTQDVWRPLWVRYNSEMHALGE